MESVMKGKKIIIAIITVMLLIDIITIITTSTIFASSRGMEYATYKLTQGIFRFLLTCLLLFFLYKGHGWARWVIAILLIIAGVFSLLSLVGFFNIVMLIMGIVFSVMSVILFVSADVKSFMKYQRGQLTFDSAKTDVDQV